MNKQISIVIIIALTAVIVAAASVKEYTKQDSKKSSEQRFTLENKIIKDADRAEIIKTYHAEVEYLTGCSPHNECNLSTASKKHHYRKCKKLLTIAEDLKNYSKHKQTDDAEEIGKKMIKFGDCNVDIAGLKLLSQFPPSTDNLLFVVDQLSTHYNEDFIELGLIELSRYKSNTDSEIINDFILNGFEKGAYVLTEKLAKHLHHFISDSNVRRFEQIIQRIPRDTQRSRLLRAAVSSFNLSQQEHLTEKIHVNQRTMD